MTNLEKFKDEIRKVYLEKGYLGDAVFNVAIRNGYKYSINHRNDQLLDWLLQEYKEPIKLKQWEYDLIKTYTDIDEAWNGRILHECYKIRKMGNEGYFKNVDLNMTFREVLDNCEVIDD